jgi:peptidyl-prolyl cis-trans isomerase SurA
MTGVKKNGLRMAAFLLGLLSVTASAQVVDRAIAVVNGHLVTWSDLDEQMRFEALENERPLKELSEADRRAAFDRLVQDWILREQMQGTASATGAEIDTRIAAIRAAWKTDIRTEDDEAKWAATLNSYGLSPQELRTLVANQLEILRFLEFRVRPLVSVSRQEVDDYYTKTLAPQVRAQGHTPEPEEQVSAKIREVLEEQKMNEEMEKWLDTLRSQSQVQVMWDGVR